MATYDEWRTARIEAEAKAAAAADAAGAQATVTPIGDGLWLVSVAGVSRGTVRRIVVQGRQRFEARLRHIDPGHGTRIGEYFELAKAVAALRAEVPRFVGRDPFKELTNYVSREQMRQRTERMRQQRRSGRYS
ncbi:hypothetical protein [Agrococcus sp. SGAir0287]|uniref:hypothetical protein n=1 Tax=Agrococcus sp. SGAir0287 TaxID=2070347 RepID=UPI0010CCDBAC|nr:hypothetical protein [Agrococcus sp. SGAir0287]QCR19740.1 hypothetical protein C1N71_10145 [Agrococcus sp. SGAir0287]